MNVNNAVKDLEKLIEEAYIIENFPLIDISRAEIKRLERENSASIKLTSEKLNVKALPEDMNNIKSEILNISLQSLAISYPKTWAVMDKKDKFKIVEILKNSNEFNNILSEVSKSVLNPKIQKIERIQNTWLWDKYESTSKFLEVKGTRKNEKWLFHGTGNTGINNFLFCLNFIILLFFTEPIKIYNDEWGFDMRHSNPGMWGNGLYFAVNAQYSLSGYAYKNKDGTRSIFYVRVAIGDDIQMPSNRSYKFPPEKTAIAGNFAVERYDSIKGNTGGSDIYIVYENSRAYPDYLITFEN